MTRRIAALLLLATAWALSSPPTRAQTQEMQVVAAFDSRVQQYTALHRLLEGPIPPIMVTKDMAVVTRLQARLRADIQKAREGVGTGNMFTPDVTALFHACIHACLEPEEIAEVAHEIADDTPPLLPPLIVNQPLPGEAPFGFFPPPLLRILPQLPMELRYVILSDGLLIWDHHADMVVDIAPGLFDAKTYKKELTPLERWLRPLCRRSTT